MFESPNNRSDAHPQSKLPWTSQIGWQDTLQHGFKAIVILSGISTLASLIATFAPFTILGSGLLVLICNLGIPLVHAWVSRKYLLNPAYRILSPARRLFLRWLSRLGFANLILYLYTPSIVWIALISCPLGFVGFTWIQHHYINWQITREKRKDPLHTLEKWALFGLAFVSITAFVILCITAATLGWLLQELLQYFDIIP